MQLFEIIPFVRGSFLSLFGRGGFLGLCHITQIVQGKIEWFTLTGFASTLDLTAGSQTPFAYVVSKDR